MDAEQLIQEACRSCLEQVRPKWTRDAETRDPGLVLRALLRSVITSFVVLEGMPDKPLASREGLELLRTERREVAPLYLALGSMLSHALVH